MGIVLNSKDFCEDVSEIVWKLQVHCAVTAIIADNDQLVSRGCWGKNTSLLLHTLETAVNVKQLCQKSTPSDALDLSYLLQYPLPDTLATCDYINLNLKYTSSVTLATFQWLIASYSWWLLHVCLF